MLQFSRLYKDIKIADIKHCDIGIYPPVVNHKNYAMIRSDFHHVVSIGSKH